MPRRRKMRGGKLTVRDVVGALKKAHDYVKKNKVISRAANALGSVGVPMASKVGAVASSLGYGNTGGRRRRRRRRR